MTTHYMPDFRWRITLPHRDDYFAAYAAQLGPLWFFWGDPADIKAAKVEGTFQSSDKRTSGTAE